MLRELTCCEKGPTLRLVLNDHGRELPDPSPDGMLVVEVRGTIAAKDMRARINDILATRRYWRVRGTH